MIHLDPVDEQARQTWQVLIDLHRCHPRGWTLIGAQLVALFAAERGRPQPRVSRDADVLVDVRLIQDGTERLSRTLLQLGFEFAGASPAGVGHRFFRGPTRVDILAPDGLGPRSRLTTLPPARTVLVPGGAQALARTELVGIRLGRETGVLPRPNLLRAILLKCRAIEVDDAPDNQRLDLAFLLAMVDDPRSMAADLKISERRWLRRRTELIGDAEARAWRDLGATVEAETARLTLRILAGV